MESDLKRCFIALDLSREIVNEIKRIQRIINKKNLFNGKFTEPENLHLTLKFLGEIEDNKIKQVIKRLKKGEFKGFEIKLGDVGVFNKKYIRIIWVEALGEVFELHKKIDDALEGLFEKEKRFMSHITIARVKGTADKKTLINYVENVKASKRRFNIDKFFLKKSELFSDGPVYTTIKSFDSSL